MTIDVKHLRELLAAATPVPWSGVIPEGRITGAGNVFTETSLGTDLEDCVDVRDWSDGVNTRLIRAAVNALPALLDRLEAAESAMRGWERARKLEAVAEAARNLEQCHHMWISGARPCDCGGAALERALAALDGGEK